MTVEFIIFYVVAFIAGIIFAILILTSKNEDQPAKSGTIVIRKNNEAIDGQVQFTRDLWDISTHKEISLKIKIISGEPGDWEEK